MLGEDIIDRGIEGTNGAISVKGLGLLNVSTLFCEYKKKTEQVEKRVSGNGAILGQIKNEKVTGYEIHMGETLIDEKNAMPAFGDDGCVSSNGLIIGTYLHGLFENKNIRNSFLGYLYKRKGMIFRSRDEGDSIEELARFVEKNVNMDLIYRRIEDEAA